MSESAICQAVGCNLRVVSPAFMCWQHWNLVPQSVKQLMARHRAPDQYAANPDYIAVVFVAISCVALEEGKPLPSLVQRGQQV